MSGIPLPQEGASAFPAPFQYRESVRLRPIAENLLRNYER